MPSYYLRFFVALAALSGCVSGPSAVGSTLASPGVTVSLLRPDPESHQLCALSPNAILAAGEPLTVEVSVAQAAHVAVVLHSQSGESEDLASDPHSPALLSPRTPRRFVVPRRSPPGVRETELRILVVASREPLAAAARELLRLPCAVTQDSGRGDRGVEESKPEPKKEPKKEEPKKTSDSRPDQGDKKGPGDVKVCNSAAGIFSPLTVIPIVVFSQ